jgi:signal transduction histidine kinase/DNA-binding NarL/FixJ family response regulator
MSKINKILYVEDEKKAQNELSEVLELFCNKLFIANNGIDGLEIYKKELPDLVISDIKMPKMNGIEMVKHIEELDYDVHIIFTTAFSDTDYFLEAIELQVDGYLLKPINLKQLRKKIDKINKKIELENIVEEKKQYSKDILDAHNSLSIVTDGKNFKSYNKKFLEFFGYKNESDIYKDFSCICEKFVYYSCKECLSKENELTWIENILENSNNIHKVKMIDKNNIEHIFIINIKETTYNQDKHYIVVFSDVTQLERLHEDKLKKEIILAEQQKMASMGNMIGNITHQWRQPLNVISSTMSSIKFKYEMNKLDIEKMIDDVSRVGELTHYLSETIDTFRNFIKEKKVFTQILIQDRIDLALKIVEPVLKDNYIETRKEIDYSKPIYVSLVLGEFIEVLINIINNAKDAIVENRVEDRWIKLKLEEKDTNILITVEDNGKGIPVDIINNIFEPYFTTKDADIGTGLGLDMSYNIVVNSLNGKLYVENSEHGAKFFIEIPKGIEKL